MLTNRHLSMLGHAASTPAVAKDWPSIADDLVKRGLAERCGGGDQIRPTSKGVAALARWLARPAETVAAGLTPKMAEADRFIRARTAEGVCPSYDEIRAALKLKTKSGVHRLVLGLERRGCLVRQPGEKRSLMPLASEART